MTALDLVGSGVPALDAFTDPIVVPVNGTSCIADVQAVVRALGRAAGMNPSVTFQLMIGASELAGALLEGPPREGRMLLRLLRDRRSIGMEIVLECGANGSIRESPLDDMKDLLVGFDVVAIAGTGSRLVARKWDSSGPGHAGGKGAHGKRNGVLKDRKPVPPGSKATSANGSGFR